MIKQETRTYYQQKTESILQYVNNNLDGDLSAKALSQLSGISQFHFHRIMKAALNEPLGSYINRIRLETAVKLVRYAEIPFQEIASRIGYNDLSSFSKAFSKEFGLSPNEFRANKTIVLNTHVDYRVNDSNKLIVDVKPKMITLPDRMVYFIRVVGKYGGPEVLKAWDELGNFVTKNKLSSWKSDIFSVYYDDSEVVGYENTVSDICISSKKIIETSEKIGFKSIPGGKYAVFRYKGPYDFLWELYDSIFRNWVLITNCKLRDLPVIEKYLNYSHNTKPKDLLTEIYIPIE